MGTYIRIYIHQPHSIFSRRMTRIRLEKDTKRISIVPKLFYFLKKRGGGNVSIQLILGGKIKMFLILF